MRAGVNSKDNSLVRAAIQRICVKAISELPRPGFLERDCYRIVSHVVAGLIERMFAGEHGGLIAILPEAQDADKEAGAGKYRFASSHRRVLTRKIAELAESRAHNWRVVWNGSEPTTSEEEFERSVAEDDEEKAKNDLDALIENIGQFSTIDNALLLGSDLEVLCAGYPIVSRKKLPVVYEATTLQGARGPRFPLLRHGSRHRAAATFAHKFPGGLAFLYSQDGDLRCFHRPAGNKYVFLWNIARSEW